MNFLRVPLLLFLSFFLSSFERADPYFLFFPYLSLSFLPSYQVLSERPSRLPLRLSGRVRSPCLLLHLLSFSRPLTHSLPFLISISSLFSLTGAQTACGITAAGSGAAAVTSGTKTSTVRTATGVPVQSFYAPTATTSGTKSGVIAKPTSGSSGSGSTSSASEERSRSSWIVGFFGLVGAVLLV